MKIVLYILLLFSCSVYVAQGDDDEFFRVEQRNIAIQKARAQDEYNAQLAEQRRLERVAAQQHDADHRLQEKAIQARAEANRAAAINAKIAQDKVDARAKVANEERLQDKASTAHRK